MENLRAPEDRAALIDPAVRRGRRYDDDVVDKVMDDTNGYPFFIQLYGDALWKGSPEEVVTAKDLRRLRSRILQALDRSFFESRYLRAAPRERRLMHMIAGHGEETSNDDLRKVGGMRNNELQPVISGLVRKGLISDKS